MLLVFLLLILIITSQFEWRQQLVSDVESNQSLSQTQKHNRISKREEAVKEKVYFYIKASLIFVGRSLNMHIVKLYNNS